VARVEDILLVEDLADLDVAVEAGAAAAEVFLAAELRGIGDDKFRRSKNN
jgi:hypothetical protein